MTRRAIGWYEMDATDEEKTRALYQAIEEASWELIELGEDPDDVVDRCEGAVDEAMAERDDATV